MDINRLKSILQFGSTSLSVTLDALESDALTQTLAPFMPDKILNLNSITKTDETAQTLSITGTGASAPFVSMKTTALFSLDEAGAVSLFITAEGQPGWTLGASFAPLGKTLLSTIKFQPSPTLYLSSYDVSAQIKTGMFFDATLASDSPLAAFGFLLGEAEPKVSGVIQMVEGIPDMILAGPTNPAADLDFFKLTNIQYELYSDARYNAGIYEWEADAYVGFSAGIEFKAQGQTYTITIMADVYDPARSVLFVVNLQDGLDAAMEELSALVNGIGLDIPTSDFQITNNIKLSDLKVMVNPGGAKKIEYITLGIQTIENWTLIEDLLTLEAIDVNFRIDMAGASKVSGVLSGLLGIGQTGTLELSANFDDFAFGGALRRGDPLNLTEVFAHFMKLNDPSLPEINLVNFDFFVQYSAGVYSGDIELQGNWEIPVGVTNLVIEDVKFSLNRMGTNAETQMSAQGVFGISDFQLVVKADYESVATGWTFEGSTGYGQQVPLGTLIGDLAKVFGVDSEMPAPVRNLTVENLHAKFNTKTKDFSFSCEAKFPIEDTLIDITVSIDLRNIAGNYTKNFGGQIKIGGLAFDLHFSQDNTSETFFASYSHPGVQQSIKIKTLVADVSSTLAEPIPESLEIEIKDVLFGFTKNATGSKFLFGLDLSTGISLSNLPLVGQEFPPEATVGVDDLQFLVASQLFTQVEASAFNNMIPYGVTKLPSSDLTQGLNVTAVLKFGESILPLSLPITSSTTTTTPPPVQPGVTSTDNAKWFNLQKSFGPVVFNRVGVQYQDSAVWFLLDAALSLSGLTLSLNGLALGSPVNKFEPEFDLRGLGINYQSGPLGVGGSFLRIPGDAAKGTSDEYDGTATLKTEQLTLSAIGSYTKLNGHPSLFLYAVLDYPLGGPSFFFVTGLSLGFGYNRSVVIPPIEQVAQFPLVAEAIAGTPAANVQSPPASGTGTSAQSKLASELQKIHLYIPPTVGEMFLAVGIKFTSFKLIDSFALLTVSVGKQFEIGVLGLSTLIVPTPVPGAPPVTPLAVVQMALRATFIPDEGFLGVDAQLTSASYVFSRACHLTGGFAFYCWFSGEHAGDFVQTLGGYHPNYVVPAHYPQVPRLGFNWRVNNELKLKGGVYFALTPSAVMAGGNLQATWESGDLKAWFNAGADFILSWKPYHYDARLYLDMGASYTFKVDMGVGTVRKKISVNVGAELHVWGPEFSGKAHIDLSVVSFDVKFGDDKSQQPKPIDWATFKSSFLPADDAVCAVSVKSGMVRTPEDDPTIDWVINPKEFSLVTNSVIPSKAAYAAGNEIEAGTYASAFGVASMGLKAKELVTSQTISITRSTGEAAEDLFEFIPILKDAPAGLWGEADASLKPKLNGQGFVKQTLAGFEVRPKQPAAPSETTDIACSLLQSEPEPVPDAYGWTEFAPFRAAALDDEQRRQTLSDTLTRAEVASVRDELLRALEVTTPVNVSEATAGAFLIPPQIESATT